MVATILDKYQQLNKSILNITKMKYFNEIYASVLALITVIGWKFNTLAGMVVMILAATAALLLTKDLKYVIPNCIYFIFMFSEGFSNDTFPIPIIIFGGIFAVVLLIFSFKDGIKVKKMKSLLGLAGLAIMTIIPIIWCRAPKGNEVFYFLFFGNLGYVLLYMIMSNGIKDNGIDLLAVSMSYLAIILTCECALKVYELRNTVDSILKLWYYLGWGLCNEAGIMICVSLPFVFYLLNKQEKISGICFQNLKIMIGVVGIILTTSRGAYLFGFIEIFILYLLLLFTAKRTRVYQNLFFVYTVLLFIVALCLKDKITLVLEEVMNLVFNEGFDDNGRMELWHSAYAYWIESPVTKIFGAGMLCEIKEWNSAVGWQVVPVVFHSTFFETLASSGLIGVLFLIIHFIQKYKNLYKHSLNLFLILGIGYFIVDIYGMIDNTYHMYYYMLPLMVTMAVIDVEIYNKSKNEIITS